MSKHKPKVTSKHRLHRRTTFKKHAHTYSKIYHPYLPVILIVSLSAAIMFSFFRTNQSGQVLNTATKTDSSSLLKGTNEKRISKGEAELIFNENLSTAAQEKADDMAMRNYWSHMTPEGKEPWRFIEQVGYKYSAASENLAYGFGSSNDTVSAWMNSPTHASALLDPTMREVGFGIANASNFQGEGAKTIVVAMYAAPAAKDKKSPQGLKSAGTLSQKISFAQTYGGGNMPWINFAAGLLIGLLSMYLVVKHTIKIRKLVRSGEQYILHHHTFDIVILGIIILVLLLTRTAGFIH